MEPIPNNGGRRRRKEHPSRSQVFEAVAPPVTPRESPREQPNNKHSSLCSGIHCSLILCSVMGCVFVMLEYHANNCNTNEHLHHLGNLTKSIEAISEDLCVIRENYKELEEKISRVSHDIPKLEGQLEILEALTDTKKYVDYSDTGYRWNPRTNRCLPNVGVYLASPCETAFNRNKNDSRKCNRTSVNKCPKLIKLVNKPTF